MMFKSISSLFNKPPRAAPNPDQTDLLQRNLLDLQSQVQSLKLEIEEKNKTIQTLNEAIDRSRGLASSAALEKADYRLEALYTAIAGPISQILTQAELIEKQGKTIPAQDVLMLVKKLIKSLQVNGLTLAGEIGQIAVYNPDLHAPVSSDSPLKPGAAVRIRFVGVNFKGKVLRKALVDPAPED